MDDYNDASRIVSTFFLVFGIIFAIIYCCYCFYTPKEEVNGESGAARGTLLSSLGNEFNQLRERGISLHRIRVKSILEEEEEEQMNLSVDSNQTHCHAETVV